MAARSIIVTLGTDNGDGTFVTKPAGKGDPVVVGAAIPSFVNLAASMAVLVADGASPTQAHVTTANNDLTTLTAASVAYNAAMQGAVGSNLVLILDTAVLTTSNKIKSAVAAALQMCRNFGIVD